MIWFLLSVAELAWLIAITVYLILERRSPTATLAWIMVLTFLPILGLPLYLVIGPRRLRRKRLRREVAREAIARRTSGEDGPGSASPVLDDPRHRVLVDVALGTGEAPLSTTREVRLFFDGDACFEALIGAIESARHHVHLEYYIFTPDRLGTRLCEELAAAARRGVEVRLLLDAFGSKKMRKAHRTPLGGSGVEVRFFNSIRRDRLKPRLANFRTHRKIAIIDGTTAMTGGMNVADEHVRSASGDAAWRDCHLLLRGAAASPLQRIFFEDWHYAEGTVPEDGPYLAGADEPGGGPPAQILSSGPDGDGHAIHRVYLAAIGAARSRVWATTAYFVPDEPLLAALTSAALRGVDVRILVPRHSDMKIVSAASRSYYAELLTAGVRLYEYRPSMLHAKTMVVDEDIAMVGSANLDNRSFRLNFEVMAVLFDRVRTDELGRWFQEGLASAEEIESRSDAEVPVLRRIVEGTARLFSPIL